MKNFKKRGWLLFAILVSTFICLFGAVAHGVPLAFWSIEMVTFFSIFSGDFKELSFSDLLVATLTLTGQLLILMALYKETLKKINRLGMLAILLLGAAFVVMCITYMDDPKIGFILTLAPFVVLSIIFLATMKSNNSYA